MPDPLSAADLAELDRLYQDRQRYVDAEITSPASMRALGRLSWALIEAWPRLLATINAQGDSGWLVLEYKRRADQAETEARQLRDRINQALAAMRAPGDGYDAILGKLQHAGIILSGPPGDCTCGRAWEGHPNPHTITCPMHEVVRDEAEPVDLVGALRTAIEAAQARRRAGPPEPFDMAPAEINEFLGALEDPHDEREDGTR